MRILVFMALLTLEDHQAGKPKLILEANIQVVVSINLTKRTAGPQATIKTQIKLNSTSTQVFPGPTLAAVIQELRSLFKI